MEQTTHKMQEDIGEEMRAFQTEMTELKILIGDKKKLECLIVRITPAEDRINELEDKLHNTSRQ